MSIVSQVVSIKKIINGELREDVAAILKEFADAYTKEVSKRHVILKELAIHGKTCVNYVFKFKFNCIIGPGYDMDNKEVTSPLSELFNISDIIENFVTEMARGICERSLQRVFENCIITYEREEMVKNSGIRVDFSIEMPPEDIIDSLLGDIVVDFDKAFPKAEDIDNLLN